MLKRIALMVIAFCCLTGCGEKEVDLNEIAEHYVQMTAVTAEADITVNSGAVAEYGILFARTETEDTVEILRPDSLAGICARILPDKAMVEYDGMALETLLPGISGFVPADAMSGLLDDLAEGMPEYYSLETLEGRETILLSYVKEPEGQTARKLVWLDRATLVPLRAEFYLNTLMIMEVRIKNFLV